MDRTETDIEQAPNTDTLPKAFVDSLDARFNHVRAIRQRYHYLVDDLGGAEKLSYNQLGIAEDIIFIEAMIQETKDKIATGKPITDKEKAGYVQMVNALVGLRRLIGIRKDRKELSLDDYIALMDERHNEHSPSD
jgi:hypothetical protein